MSILVITMVAKPFTDWKARALGLNIHQKNLFMSTTKIFVSGFGEDWDKDKYQKDYDENKRTEMKFFGDADWIQKQHDIIRDEAFKAIMEDQYRTVRNKIRRIMPKKATDKQIEENATFDKFVNGLSLFNITCLMDIEDGDESSTD